MALQFDVPQGSVLGPRVFVQYAKDVDDIFQRHGVHHHLFADDMQGHFSGRLDDVPAIVSRLESCIIDIYAWCGAKRLHFNADKTELLWFGPASQLRRLPSQNNSINVNRRKASDCRSRPGRVVRRRAINALACFSGGTDMFLPSAPNKNLRAVRRQLGRDVTARLVTAFVLSRLDCCNDVLAGLPASILAPLQRVLHAAARTVMDLKPRDRVTPVLRELLWLPVAERIQYKLCLLVHKSLLGHTPEYISDLLTSVANIPVRSTLRAS